MVCRMIVYIQPAPTLGQYHARCESVRVFISFKIRNINRHIERKTIILEITIKNGDIEKL